MKPRTAEQVLEDFAERLTMIDYRAFAGDIVAEVVLAYQEALSALQEDLLGRLPVKKYHKEFECNHGTHESFCENQNCPNAKEERAYNQALKDVKKAIIEYMGGRGRYLIFMLVLEVIVSYGGMSMRLLLLNTSKILQMSINISSRTIQ